MTRTVPKIGALLYSLTFCALCSGCHLIFPFAADAPAEHDLGPGDGLTDLPFSALQQNLWVKSARNDLEVAVL